MKSIINEFEPFAFKRMEFVATINGINNESKSVRLSGIKMFNIIPTSETIWSYEFDKFNNIPEGSIIKFSGVINPIIKSKGSKLTMKYSIINIEIDEVKKFELQTRENLKNYKGKYVMCTGMISNRGLKKHKKDNYVGKSENVVCVNKVKINEAIDLDHVWIDEPDALKEIPNGLMVSFTGKVAEYYKLGRNLNGKLRKNGIKDYQLIDINNVEIVY